MASISVAGPSGDVIASAWSAYLPKACRAMAGSSEKSQIGPATPSLRRRSIAAS
jgi:hypothetical protein